MCLSQHGSWTTHCWQGAVLKYNQSLQRIMAIAGQCTCFPIHVALQNWWDCQKCRTTFCQSCKKYSILPPSYLDLQETTKFHLRRPQYLWAIITEEMQITVVYHAYQCTPSVSTWKWWQNTSLDGPYSWLTATIEGTTTGSRAAVTVHSALFIGTIPSR